jgi:hypothetical protein
MVTTYILYDGIGGHFVLSSCALLYLLKTHCAVCQRYRFNNNASVWLAVTINNVNYWERIKRKKLKVIDQKHLYFKFIYRHFWHYNSRIKIMISKNYIKNGIVVLWFPNNTEFAYIIYMQRYNVSYIRTHMYIHICIIYNVFICLYIYTIHL